LAFLIDKVVITLLTIAIGGGLIIYHVLLYDMNPQEVQDKVAGIFVYVVYGLTAAYYVFMESSLKQSTIGKMLMR
jgi:uncharacterized RDD family membrane protein YckC